MPKGGARPGAGRPPGSPSKASIERQRRITSTGATPLDVMIEAMRFFRGQAALAQQENPPDLGAVRIWLMAAAKIAADAAKYVHPTLSAVMVTEGPTEPDADPEAARQKIGRLIELKANGPDRLVGIDQRAV